MLDRTNREQVKHKPAHGDEKIVEPDELLICRVCANPITSKSEQIEVNECLVHTFENPGGIIFTIGCFKNAVGCTSIGSATLQYTWFPGYAWRVCVCRECHNHLGWHYQLQQDHFFGLIMKQLVSGMEH